MKKRCHTIAALALTLLSASAFEAPFHEAQAAYDAGRYVEARALYEGLLSNGVVNVEVHYNLANASFKKGDLPQAVWHYRKAWYLSPRDPDIRANLHFALNAAGAAAPAAGLPQRIFNTASTTEWLQVAIGSYLLFTLLVLLGILIRPAKRVLLQISLIPAALILVAAGGWWHWHGLQEHPEWVVVKSGATALYGPVDGSTAHYKLPLAALVRQQAVDPKGWVEVQYDGKKGWIHQDYIRPVSP